MDARQVRRVLTGYDTLLGKRGHEPERADTSTTDPFDVPGSIPSGGNLLQHARWMCQEAVKFLPDPYCACSAPSCDLCHPPAWDVPADLEKAMRWLGFVQGVLWSTGVRTIDQMRKDNTRPA